jgi:anti-sigma B factor antagonist
MPGSAGEKHGLGGARMALEIAEKNIEGATVLALAGQVVVGDPSNRLRDKTREILNRGRTDLVMDFGRVTYIDSTGLGTILAIYTTARNLGANIKLACLSKKFRDQLRTTGLEKVFEIFDQVEGAAKSYQAKV